jgi:hypothetical protein
MNAQSIDRSDLGKLQAGARRAPGASPPESEHARRSFYAGVVAMLTGRPKSFRPVILWPLQTHCNAVSTELQAEAGHRAASRAPT